MSNKNTITKFIINLIIALINPITTNSKNQPKKRNQPLRSFYNFNKIAQFVVVNWPRILSLVALFTLLWQFILPILAVREVGGVLAQSPYIVNADDDIVDLQGCNETHCSLREAINAASANDLITFHSNLNGTGINITSQLSIDKNLTITGNGATNTIIQATASLDNSLFNITGGTVIIQNLTIKNVDADASGNPVVNGGAINHSSGILTLNSVIILNNTVDGNGGGIYNDGGTININDSTIKENKANANDKNGGGIYNNSGTIIINGGSIAQNEAIRDTNTYDDNDHGGGIYNKATLEIYNISINKNIAGDNGGGIFNEGASATILIDNSSITENEAKRPENNAGGGGIYNNGGTITITNSSQINLNKADGNDGDGGGIYNYSGSVTMTGGTINNNKATNGDNTYDNDDHGGGIYNKATLHLTDVAITGNTAGDNGGGLLNDGGTVTIIGGSIDGNFAKYADPDAGGGGIYNKGGSSSITISGNTSIINNQADGNNGKGGGIYNDNGEISITDATIQNNQATDDGSNDDGDCGGGIYNNKTLNLTNVTIDNNTATDSGGGLCNTSAGIVDINGGQFNTNHAYGSSSDNSKGGGAIFNVGSLTVDGVTFDTNDTSGDGGAIFNSYTANSIDISNSTFNSNSASDDGGAIFSKGPLSLDTVTVDGNTSTDSGGGIRIQGNYASTILNSTISNNITGDRGGGIYNYDHSNLTIENSTISTNTAVTGGGIYQSKDSNDPQLTIKNSTISNNTATTGRGGGIFHYHGDTVLNNVTIVQNSATDNGGGLIRDGSDDGSGDITIKNTIIANNTTDANGPDCIGNNSIDSKGYNWIGDGSSCLWPADVTGDQIDAGDPNLSPLTNNGGTTLTHAPLPDSLVIDAGNPGPPDGTTDICEATDQVGTLRPKGAECDIGAYEVPIPDLTFDKSVNPSTAQYKDVVTYTITINNQEAENVTGLAISDTLATDLSFVPGSVTIIPTVTAIITNNLPDLVSNLTITANTEIVITFLATVATEITQTTILNKAVIDKNNYVITESEVSLTIENPQLALSKIVNDPEPTIGSPLTYTIIITNDGAANITDGVVLDNLPLGITLANITNPVTLNPPQNIPLATSQADLPTLATSLIITAGQSVILTVHAIVGTNATPGNPLTNTAIINSSGGVFSAMDSISIVPFAPPLTVTKSVNNPTPAVGEIITYTISLTNNPLIPTTNVVVEDELPPGVIFIGPVIRYGPSTAAFPNPITQSNNILFLSESFTMSKESLVVFKFPVQVGPNTIANNPLINTASVNSPDINGTLVATVPITVINPTITMHKSVDNPTPGNSGDSVIYTIVITNSGPGDLVNAIISDPLTNNLELDPNQNITITPIQAGITNNTLPILATNVTIAASNTITLTVPVLVQSGVPSGTLITNQASISVAHTLLANNTAVITPIIPSLEVNKTVDKQLTSPGSLINYTITISNPSTGTANNVQVYDLLEDPNLTLGGPITINPNSGIIHGTTQLSITQLSVPASGNVSIIVPVQVSSNATIGSIITNTVTVNNSGQETTASEVIKILSLAPDLSISKTVNDPTPYVGQIITYTVIITNDGLQGVNNGTLNDALTPELVLAETIPISIAPNGAGTPGTTPPILAQNLSIGKRTNFNQGESVTIRIPALVQSGPSNGGETITNTATANFGAITTEDATAIITVNNPNLILTKTVDITMPSNTGELVTYKIIVTNNGDGHAANVVISDTLPPELELAGVIISTPPFSIGVLASTANDLPYLLTGGLIAPSETYTIEVPVYVKSEVAIGTSITNTATIRSGIFSATDSISVTVHEPALAIHKSVNKQIVSSDGTDVIYTIVITNLKSDTSAGNLKVTDILPPELNLNGNVIVNPPDTVYSYLAEVGNFDKETGLLIDGVTLQEATKIELTVPVHASPSGSANLFPKWINNKAVVRSGPNNSTDNVNILMLSAEADLSIKKISSHKNPNAGQTITYSIIITNDGLSAATVSVSDIEPKDITFITDSVSINPSDAGTPGFPPRLATGVTIPPRTSLNKGEAVIVNVSGVISPDLYFDTYIENTAFVNTLQATVGFTANRDYDQIGIYPSQDNTLYENFIGILSNGQGEYFFAGRNNLVGGQEIRRGVIAFDIAASDIPPGSKIHRVTLKLHLSRSHAGPQPVTLHKLTQAWGEGASNAEGGEGGGATAQFNDATWVHTFYNTAQWLTPGGAFTTTTAVSITVDDTIGYYEWSSEEMITDVQYWLDNPEENFGWILLGEEDGHTTTKRFDSLQNSNSEFWPQLLVGYLPPPLVAHKTVNHHYPQEGDLITYTITIDNNDVQAITNVFIEDTLAPELNLIGGEDSIVISPPNPQAIIATIGQKIEILGLNIQNNSSVTIKIPVQLASDIPNGKQISNTVIANSSQVITPSIASTIVTVTNVKLDLHKTVSNFTPSTGETIEYLVTVINNGSDQATGIKLEDYLSNKLTFVGPVTDTSQTWQVTSTITNGVLTMVNNATLLPNSQVTLRFPVKINANLPNRTIIDNLVILSSPEITQPITANVSIEVGKNIVYLPIILK